MLLGKKKNLLLVGLADEFDSRIWPYTSHRGLYFFCNSILMSILVPCMLSSDGDFKCVYKGLLYYIVPISI